MKFRVNFSYTTRFLLLRNRHFTLENTLDMFGEISDNLRSVFSPVHYDLRHMLLIPTEPNEFFCCCVCRRKWQLPVVSGLGCPDTARRCAFQGFGT